MTKLEILRSHILYIARLDMIEIFESEVISYEIFQGSWQPGPG
jgi:hypothetical protein